MGGGVESMMEWELVTDASDRLPPSSAASTTSEPAPNNDLILSYLSNLDIDFMTKSGNITGSNACCPRDGLRHSNEGFEQSATQAPLQVARASPPLSSLSQSEVQSPPLKAPSSNSEAGGHGIVQATSIDAEREIDQQKSESALPPGLDWAPMTVENASTEEPSKCAVQDPPVETEVDSEVGEEGAATVAILKKVTELALLQKSLPRANEQGAALAVVKLLKRLEEAAGGPWEGLPTVEATLIDGVPEIDDSVGVIKALDGFFNKVTEALRLNEVRVHLSQAEEKARQRRKKRMQFLGMVGGMSALVFVGAAGACLAAEASLASAYTAYNIFFNPTAITAASAAVDAASGVASLCGLGAVVPGATAASLGVLDMLKAHSQPIRVGQVARLKMLDWMLGQLTEGSCESAQDPDVLKASVLRKWRELALEALSDTEIVQKLTAERAGRCSRVCGVAATSLTSASIQSLVRHARLLDLVDQLEVLVWNTCFVGVIGPQNAGKSTLIKAMAEAAGRKDVGVSDIGLKSHTKKVGAYQLKDALWVLDCPGSDSISDELAEAWTKFNSLPSFFVLVLHYGTGITRSISDLYQQVRARFPETRIVTVVNQVDRYWDELEEDGVEESRLHLVQVFERAVGEKVDVRFSVLNDKKFGFDMFDNGVLGSESACERIFQTAEEMSRAFA